MAETFRALWKCWTEFKNLRKEIDLNKRNERFDEFSNFTQMVIQRSLLNEILPFLQEHCGHFGMTKAFDWN